MKDRYLLTRSTRVYAYEQWVG